MTSAALSFICALTVTVTRVCAFDDLVEENIIVFRPLLIAALSFPLHFDPPRDPNCHTMI